MTFLGNALLFTTSLLLALLAAMELGRAVGRRLIETRGDGATPGVGAIEGSIFALLGLIIAFTFTGASGRFDARRQLIVQHSNAIGTAWLRLDLLPPDAQPRLRKLMIDYVDLCESVTSLHDDTPAMKEALAGIQQTTTEIWRAVTAAVQKDGRPFVPPLVLPPMNEMFDLGSARLAAGRMHAPPMVFAMLFALSVLSAFMAGIAMASRGQRNWLHMIAFAFTICVTVYVIIDLEYPRHGLIRLDAADRPMIETRESLVAPPTDAAPVTESQP